jgi:hypothetical protein
MNLERKIDIEEIVKLSSEECVRNGHPNARLYHKDIEKRIETYYCENCNGYFHRNINP